MNFGFRVFFLEEDGSLRSIPWPTYVGLYSGFPAIRFPEYSGKAVKCVHVVVELENKVPVSILESIFFVTHFDKNGGMDQEKKVERQRIAGESENEEEQESPQRSESGAVFNPFLSTRQGSGAAQGRQGPAKGGQEQRVIDLLPKLSERCCHKSNLWELTRKETEDLERRVEELLEI
jgi:hypothetical protein